MINNCLQRGLGAHRSCLRLGTLLFLGCRLAVTGATPSGSSLSPKPSAHDSRSLPERAHGAANLFSSYDSPTRFVRNTSFWLRHVSGVAAIHIGYPPGAMAITSWHILGANHFRHEAGSKVCFCDPAGIVVARTVVAGAEIRADIKSEIWLGLLDAPLPGSIIPLPLLPVNWTNLAASSPLKLIAMNQRKCFGAVTLGQPQAVPGWFAHGYAYRIDGSEEAPRFQPLQAGDSGNPILLLSGNQLALVGHLTFEQGTNAFAGPDYASYAGDIQEAIKTLGTNRTARAQRFQTVGPRPSSSPDSSKESSGQ